MVLPGGYGLSQMEQMADGEWSGLMPAHGRARMKRVFRACLELDWRHEERPYGLRDVAGGAGESAVPMVKYLGLEVVEVGPGRGIVRLPDKPELLNHVKSQHAAGLFAAAETASGAAMTGALADKMAGMTPLAKSAEIAYKRLAKGPVTATATLSEDADAIGNASRPTGRRSSKRTSR